MQKILYICVLVAVVALIAGCGSGGGFAGALGDSTGSSSIGSASTGAVLTGGGSTGGGSTDGGTTGTAPVTVNPEPSSLLLLASGLFGVATFYIRSKT